jgi:transposase
MENIKYSVLLFNSLKENNINNKIKIITDLFKIDKSTFYKRYNKYNENFKINNDDINTKIIYDFNFLNVNKLIVNYIVSYVVTNLNINLKIIKKKINLFFPNNKLSYKQIRIIINKNNLFFNNSNKRNNYKINNKIEKFVIEQIELNNTLSAKNIIELIKDKFNINISLTSIYNLLKKNNYTYKKTSININPHSFDDQKQQLINVYEYLNNNNQIINTFNDEYIKNIKKMNELLNKDMISLKESFNLMSNEKIIDLSESFYESKQLNNNTFNELVSIDEFSIITNRTSNYGWALSGTDCIISLPYVKPNKRYSLLMATTKKKIIKYVLVEKSIKTDNFISFMDDLNKLNNNYSYLIDNASIHSNKKTKMFFKLNKMNIIYNAPYQSKFNPIEMVFSLLRKKLNKKIVKNEQEIIEVVELFIKEIKEETLKNIFSHSTKLLKLHLEVKPI